MEIAQPSIEKRLAGILRPLTPRREFVRNLRHRIETLQSSSMVNRFSNLKYWLLLLTGVVSIGIIIVVLAFVLKFRFRRK